MSFLSEVNLSNAASIAALSVLLSTTRKFFCESGGAVTCCRKAPLAVTFIGPYKGMHTPIPASSSPVTESFYISVIDAIDEAGMP
jgi:hypothetical protein